MEDRIDRLEGRIDALTSRVDALTEEIRAGRRPEAPASRPDEAREDPTPAPHGDEDAGEGWAFSRNFEQLVARHAVVILAGLASIVLAGAIVLRQVANSELLPVSTGAALGLLYGATLLLVAAQRYRRGATLQGEVFAVLAVGILDILVVEVARRPDGFSRPTAYAALAVALGLLSLLALQRRRVVPFAVCILAAPAAAIAIGGRPFHHPLFAAILGLCLVWAQVGKIVRGWGAFRWVLAIAGLGYLPFLASVSVAAVRRDLDHLALARPAPALAVMVGLLLVLVFPAIQAALRRGRKLDAFEVFAAMAGALVVLPSAARILSTLPDGGRITALAGLTLGAIFYGLAALGYVRHGAESRCFYAWSVNALVYILVGLAYVTPSGAIYGTAAQALALTLAVFAARLGKKTLSLQAVLVTVLAFVVHASSTIDLTVPGGDGGVRFTNAAWLLAAGTMAIGVFAWQRSFHWKRQHFSLHRFNAPATALVLVLTIGLFDLLAGSLPLVHRLAVDVVPGGPETRVREDLWLAIQTLILVGGALCALGLAARLRLGGATVLAATVMFGAGMKIFLVDATRVRWPFLVVSATAFGLALIASSLVYRRFRGIERSTADGEP